MNKRFLHWSLWIIGLLGLLLVITMFSLSVGSSKIPFMKIIPLLFDNQETTEKIILLNIRIPRIILGIAIGGALSISGVILQGLFRNPLVEPYTLGISGGAALGVCINIICKLNHLSVATLPISGFIGAMVVVLLTYSLGMKKGILKIQGLLLTGVMISFIATSLVMLLMAMSSSQNLQGIIFWIMGSLDEPDWILISIMLVSSAAGLIIAYFFYTDLNALALGEEEARHLGINVERTKKSLFLIASILTGVSVSVGGVIGFVGLAVPHVVRLFFGSDHRIVLIASYLVGACFLVVCDTLARTVIAPLELPVGVITGIVGGIIFVYALLKSNRNV